MLTAFARLAAAAAGLLLAGAGLLPTARAQAPTATWQWAVRGATPSGSVAASRAAAVQTDAAGNTYLAGTFAQTLTLGPTTLTATTPFSSYVAKFGPGGSLLWARQLSSPATSPLVYRLALDGAGNVYLTGQFEAALSVGSFTLADPTTLVPGQGRANGFVLQLSPAGVAQWGLRVGRPSSLSLSAAICNGLAVDATGQLAVAGYLTGEVSAGGQPLAGAVPNGVSFYVLRLQPAGSAPPTVQWARTAPLSQTTFDSAVAFGTAGAVYAGTTTAAATAFGPLAVPAAGSQPGAVLVQYDAGGTAQWARRLPAPPATGTISDAMLTDLAADPAGGVSVLTQGTAYSPTTSRGVLLQHYSAQGAADWQQSFSTPTTATTANALAVAASGNLYVAGGLQGSFTLAGTSISSSAPTTTDAFVFSCSPQGSVRWGQAVSSGTGAETLLALAVAADESLHLGGQATGAAQLGTLALPASGTGSQLLAGHLVLGPLAAAPLAGPAAFGLAPNPARAFATLTLPAAPAARAFALLDALGRPVRHYTVPAGATTARLEVAGLPAGLYVLHGAGASRKLVLE